jgi:hypothetical protein
MSEGLGGDTFPGVPVKLTNLRGLDYSLCGKSALDLLCAGP